MSNRFPIFIFEGIEGTGKSTQIKNLCNFFKKKKIPHIKLREPGGSKNSEKIRKILLNNNSSFNPTTDLFLYLASRSENIEKIINKNINKKIILIDRFIFSTLAYQHYGMGINKNLINNLNKFLIRKLKITHIFLHTVDKKNLYKRLSNRKNKNRYDKFRFQFYNKVQKGYIKTLKNKKNVTIIDTKKNQNDNEKQILKIVKKYVI